MKIALIPHVVPHLPVEDGQDELAICRFMRTYHQFDPGHPHELILNCCDHPGRDIAAHQHMARVMVYSEPHFKAPDIAVFMSARTFFHRSGWLLRLVDVMTAYDMKKSVFGVMASCEASPNTPDDLPNPHLRTCLFACDPKILADSPPVLTQSDGFFFESQWLTRRSGLRCYLVTWQDWHGPDNFRTPTNGFRSGDQSNILVQDRHSAAYSAATPEQQQMLTRIANGEKIS